MAIDPDLKSPRKLLWIIVIVALIVLFAVWIFDPTGKVKVPLMEPVAAPAEELLPPATGAPAVEATPIEAIPLTTEKDAATAEPAR